MYFSPIRSIFVYSVGMNSADGGSFVLYVTNGLLSWKLRGKSLARSEKLASFLREMRNDGPAVWTWLANEFLGRGMKMKMNEWWGRGVTHQTPIDHLSSFTRGGRGSRTYQTYISSLHLWPTCRRRRRRGSRRRHRRWHPGHTAPSYTSRSPAPRLTIGKWRTECQLVPGQSSTYTLYIFLNIQYVWMYVMYV